MSDDAGDGATTLAPDDAFAALGNDTRIRIVEVLGEADGPLSFSELRDRVGVSDSARFNYHLDKLVGHFVDKTDDGYDLRRAGERVVEAILSGAVTHDPVVERTPIDETCPHCGAPVEVAYSQERLTTYCTECEGTYAGDDADTDEGYLGFYPLPPAGLRSRSPTWVHRAAHTWNMSERLRAASGVCPRCSATLEESVDVCEDHDPSEGVCEACGGRHAVQHSARCPNCIFDQQGAFVVALLANTDLLAFLTDHGINPVSPRPPSSGLLTATVMDYEEEVVSVDPFEARFRFEIDDDALVLTVDDDLDVVDARRS